MTLRIRSGHIPALDGIRGIAIFFVMIWHYICGVPAPPGSPLAYLQRILSLTWSGVDLFFVLSGFLIGGLLLDNRESPTYFRVFYIRRFWRIAPLYLFLVVIGFLLAHFGLIYEDKAGELIALPWYLTFTQNIWMAANATWSIWLSQTWSLAVEEQFYLLLPLLVWFVVPARLTGPLIVFIVAAPVLRIAMYWALPDAHAGLVNYVLLPTRMDALFSGVLCAVAVRNRHTWDWIVENVRLLYFVVIGALAVCAVMIVKGWGLGSPSSMTIGFSIFALLYSALVLIAVAETRGPVHWATTRPIIMKLGIWAYSLYLLHTIIPFYILRIADNIGLVEGIARASIVMFSYAMVFIGAHFSWRYLEKPCIAFGHKWRYERAAQPASHV